MEGPIKLKGLQIGTSLTGTADGFADLASAETSVACGTRLGKPVADADAAAAFCASALDAAVGTVADADIATSTAPLSVHSDSATCPPLVEQFAAAPWAGAVRALSSRHVIEEAAWGVEVRGKLAAEASPVMSVHVSVCMLSAM